MKINGLGTFRNNSKRQKGVGNKSRSASKSGGCKSYSFDKNGFIHNDHFDKYSDDRTIVNSSAKKEAIKCAWVIRDGKRVKLTKNQ